MSLRRTAGGLASLHLFFRVDCIVYCEGGFPLGEADVLAGQGDEQTLDVMFWKSICEFVGAKRNYHFKSVGSKTTLKSIAADIATHGIATVLVSLDRDYDWHCARHLNHPRVLYTYGYSWESDTVCALGLERLFFRLFPKTPVSKKIFADGLTHIRKVGAELVKWCETEIALSARKMDLLFVRDKPSASLELNGVILPGLSVVRIRTSLTRVGLRRRPKRLVAVATNEVFRHVWGKLASRLFYHVFVRLAQRCDDTVKMNYDMFMRFMISEMLETVKQGLSSEEKLDYYQQMSSVLT